MDEEQTDLPYVKESFTLTIDEVDIITMVSTGRGYFNRSLALRKIIQEWEDYNFRANKKQE